MPTYEHAALLQHKDQNGDMHIDYPITKPENVVGLYEDPALSGIPTAPTANKGTNTIQIATTEFVQTELTDIKKELSDGMTDVAAAITEKGVETATDATLVVMANNIRAISTSSMGSKLNIFTQLEEPSIKDGLWIKTASAYKHIICNDKVLYEDGSWGDLLDLPIKQYRFSTAAVYKGHVHILGGHDSRHIHYRLNDDGTWTSISSLPVEYYLPNGAVEYNEELYILGSRETQGCVYKFNGSSWSSVASCGSYSGASVVYNNEIHLLGGATTTDIHYKFNGSTWTSVSTLPAHAYDHCAAVFNGALYMIGGEGSAKRCYIFDGNCWSVGPTMPCVIIKGDAFVYNGELHVIPGSSRSTYHYKFDGSTWTSVSTLPSYINDGAAVSIGPHIYLLGCYNETNNAHDKYAVFTSSTAMFENNSVVFYRGEHNGVYTTCFTDVSDIEGINTRFVTGFDDAWYFDQGTFDMSCEMYYGDGTQWIKFKN